MSINLVTVPPLPENHTLKAVKTTPAKNIISINRMDNALEIKSVITDSANNVMSIIIKFLFISPPPHMIYG
jgi:hypothetical protein